MKLSIPVERIYGAETCLSTFPIPYGDEVQARLDASMEKFEKMTPEKSQSHKEFS